MDSAAVSNDMVDNGKRTYHCCARCIAFFGEGNYRFAGLIGCVFPPITDKNWKLYRAWVIKMESSEDIQYLKCFRCFLTGNECCALPEDLREDLKEIKAALDALADPTIQDSDIAVKKNELRDVCHSMAKSLSTQYQPHSEHLTLHSGAIDKDGNPNSDARPSGRKRDKKTMAAKLEASKRALEASVAEEAKTPRKKAKGVAINTVEREARSRLDQLTVDIARMETERADAPTRQKGGYTKRINAANKERDQLLASLPK